MRISVFGLGYVGTVSAACLARQGHQVIGVDINPQKVEIINSGRSPVIEQEIDEYIAQAVSEGNLRGTTDATDAVQNSDLSLICVGTPSKENGSLDLTFVKRASRNIGQVLAEKDGFHTVVLRSTVLPGTTKEVVLLALESSSGKIAGQDFGLCNNPEFLREGSSVYDYFHPPFTVIGEVDPGSAEIAARMYKGLDAPLLIMPLENAEMIKYACNAFHALKVSFANEIGNLCKSRGIDSHQLMDVFCLDDKLNLSSYYLKPGFAFGGSCLPKDLRALLYHGRRHDLDLPVLKSILPSNENQIKRGIEMVRRSGFKQVGVLGFSFKAGTDDLRESPLVVMIETLLGKGFQVKIYDRNVSLARVHGANRAYIEREIPHIASLMCNSIDEVMMASKVIVIGNNDSEFREVFAKANPEQVIVDLVRLSKEAEVTEAQYDGICW